MTHQDPKNFDGDLSQEDQEAGTNEEIEQTEVAFDESDTGDTAVEFAAEEDGAIHAESEEVAESTGENAEDRDDRAGIRDVLPLSEDLRLEAKVEAIIFASPKPMRATEIYEILLANQTEQATLPEQANQAEAELDAAPEMVAAEDQAAADLQLEGEQEQLITADPTVVTSAGLTLADVQDALDNLQESYRDRCGGFHLAYIKRMGYQFQTVPAAAALMEKQFARRPRPISRAALETLSIIAYRQPCTRAEVEFVRGVDAGSIINGLLERGMITCVGRKEIPGRPMMFGTTDEFLKTFQLGSVKDLPSLESFQPANDVLKAAFEKLEAGPEATDVEEFIGDEDFGNSDETTLEKSLLDPDVAEAAREVMIGTSETITADITAGSWDESASRPLDS